MPYLLDANVFIEARNRYYGFDLCPGFWQWLTSAHAEGDVLSVEKVADELTGRADDISDWVSERRATFFLPPDPAMIPALAEIAEWVKRQSYTQAAISEFLDSADYYLIARARVHGEVVVTHERPESSTKKVKIPNVCIGFGIRFMNTFDMLRIERVRFVLGGT